MLNVLDDAKSLRNNKTEDVLRLYEMAREKISDVDNLFCIGHYEDKARYNRGIDNYVYILTNADRTRIVLIEMEFSHFNFIKISDNGTVTRIDYIK